MPPTPVTFLLTRLDACLHELQEARQRRDDEAEWTNCLLALTLLHQLDEAGLKAAPTRGEYWARRGSSTDGQTLAALVWFRGSVHHHQTGMKDSFKRGAKAYLVGDDGELKPLKIHSVATGGQMVPVTPSVVISGWPARNDFPPSTEPAHGRDAWYDLHVAEKSLMPPLLAAKRFLHAEFGDPLPKAGQPAAE